MRRSDREITDRNKMIEILRSCEVVRLGLSDEKGVYIVPMNFGIKTDGEDICLCLHSAKEGRKTGILKSGATVSFEADTNHRLKTGTTACEYSYFYQCVMGQGKIITADTFEEKLSVLRCLMSRYSEKNDFEFSSAAVEKTFAFMLKITDWSCKEH